MIIGVIGGRDNAKGALYDNHEHISVTLDGVVKMYDLDLAKVSVVGGGARGSELLANAWADAKGIPCQTVPPRIKKFAEQDDGNMSAFRERNQRIISQSDIVVFFWDGTQVLIHEAIMTCSTFKKLSVVSPLL